MPVSETLLSQVAPEWRADFVKFLETGEASEAFEKYLDSDEDAQRAFDEAFKKSVHEFEQLLQEA